MVHVNLINYKVNYILWENFILYINVFFELKVLMLQDFILYPAFTQLGSIGHQQNAAI